MIFHRKKHSLTTKITVATLAGLVLVFSVVAFGGWLSTKKLLQVSQDTMSDLFQEEIVYTEVAMLNVLGRKGNSLTEIASQIASIKIIAFDYEALKQYLKNILNDEDVIYAIYEIDVDNVVIAEHIPLYNTPWEQVGAHNEPEAVRALADQMIEAGYVLEFSRNIEYNSEKIGKVSIGLSKENLIEVRENAIENLNKVEQSLHRLNTLYFKKQGIFLFLIYAGAFVFLGAMLYFIVKTLIIDKLKKMSTAFEQVSSGDLTKRIDLASSDEIGDLSRTFNNMTGSLQKLTVSRDNLEESNRVLRKTQEELAKSHQELEVSNEFRSKLIENSPSGIMIVASNGTIIDINVAGAGILGQSKTDILSRKLDEFFPAAQDHDFAVNSQLFPWK